jgi:hypothetical protein
MLAMFSLYMSSTDTWLYATDIMDKWDEELPSGVILSKHGNPRITVDVSWRAPLLFSPDTLSFQIAYKSFTEVAETQL